MDADEKRKRMNEFVNSQSLPYIPPGRLAAALYTMSELGMWPDEVDSVSEQQAILIWLLVKQLIVRDFPPELKM